MTMPFFKRLVLIGVMLFSFWACSQDDDGPLNLSSGGDVFEGMGFFLASELDSGSSLHLVSDTLYVGLGNIWSFSNCALKSIGMKYETEDTVLVLTPQIHIRTTEGDCPSPYYRPDTVMKVVLGENLMKGISQIQVKNDQDSILDSIIVRRGSFSLDTFEVYIDSLFDSVQALPLRTKGSPSVLRVLDSITPRVFIWRTMNAKCDLKIDACDEVVPDTLFPSSWVLGDTNLVPVRVACADTDMVYCHSSHWINDSTDLGSVQERPDTIWHTSTYYIETIPECGALNSFSPASIVTQNSSEFVRELFTPDESETFCGPSTTKDLYIYDLSRGAFVPDTVNVDSLYKVWKNADVARSK